MLQFVQEELAPSACTIKIRVRAHASPVNYKYSSPVLPGHQPEQTQTDRKTLPFPTAAMASSTATNNEDPLPTPTLHPIPDTPVYKRYPPPENETPVPTDPEIAVIIDNGKFFFFFLLLVYLGYKFFLQLTKSHSASRLMAAPRRLINGSPSPIHLHPPSSPLP